MLRPQRPLAAWLAATALSAPLLALQSPLPPPAGGGMPAPESSHTRNRARGASDGLFLLRADEQRPAAGPRLWGVVNPGLAEAALPIYREVAPGPGLMRMNVYMHVLQARPDNAARVLAMSKEAGYRVLLTAMGTPRWNATWKPPEKPWYTLPRFARSQPRDPQAWADDLVSLLAEIETLSGYLPDYLEIWNEPDRWEFYTGKPDAFLELFAVAAATVKAAYPQIRVGGPGVSAAEGRLPGTTESLLTLLVDRAAALGHPLDFLSWHNYSIASQARYDDSVHELRAALARRGLAAELIVSEWNIYPSALYNPNALELDGSHAAANLAGFLAAFAELGLDGHCFFMLQDAEPGMAISDLTGVSTGALSHRGVKKPVFRAMELMRPMALEPLLRVDYPADEWALALLATRAGERVRLAIANDVVPPEWVWSNGCRERGADPGRLWAAVELLRENNIPITAANLVQWGGLDPWEADVAIEVLRLVEEASRWQRQPRVARVRVAGGVLQPELAWRFDARHNSPVSERDQFEPWLEWVEEQARAAAFDVANSFLSHWGCGVPENMQNGRLPASPEELARVLDIPLELASVTWNLYFQTLYERRLDHSAFLNSLEAADLDSELPAEAGVSLSGGELRVLLQPNALTVLDCTLEPSSGSTPPR